MTTLGEVFAYGPVADRPSPGIPGRLWVDTSVTPYGLTYDTGAGWIPLLFSIVPRGVWNSTSTYQVNDVVSDAGVAWVAMAVNVNSEPASNNTHWMQLSAPGPAGDPGIVDPASLDTLLITVPDPTSPSLLFTGAGGDLVLMG